MPFCTNCGSEVGENKKFCPNCGQPVKEKSKSESIANTEIEDKKQIVEETNRQPKKKLETKTRQSLTDKLTKKHKILIVSVVAILLLFIGGFNVYSYLNSPETAAKNFLKALNEKEFEKAYAFFTDITDNITKEMVIASLTDMSEKKSMQYEKMNGIERMRYLQEEISESDLNNENKAFIPVLYKDKDREEQLILTFEKDEDGKWKTPFFLPLYDVTVSAPKGTTIFLDKKEIGTVTTGNEIAIDSILEGKHIVEMKFAKDIVPPFQEKIYVDNHYYLESPYETYSIYIYTIPGVEVTFDGEPVVNESRYITLDEVLEAEHDIIITSEGMIEPLTTKITVDSEHTNFQFYNFNLIKDYKVNEKFQAEVFNLLKNFNDADIIAGEEKDTNYYKPYVTYSFFNEKFKNYFDDYWWKKYTFSEYTMEPIKIELASIDKVYFTVRESWHTIEDVTKNGWTFNLNGDVRLERKSKLEWKYEIILDSGSWKISGDELLNRESKYLDKNGKWVSY